MNFVETVLAATASSLTEKSPEQVSERFFAAMAPHNVSYLQTRVYRRPVEPLTSENHWQAGGIVARFAPEGWAGSSAFDYVCFRCNPLLPAVRAGRTSWRFDDYAPKGERRFTEYWDALGEAGIADAVGSIASGENGWLANIHLGVADASIDKATSSALSFGAVLLANRLLDLCSPSAATKASLTERETDCLSFVAAGKSDWDISVILGIAESTVKFHVDNARRRLNANTRAHAVARLALRGGL